MAYQATFSNLAVSSIQAKLFKSDADRLTDTFYDSETIPVYTVQATSTKNSASISQVISKDLHDYLVANTTATMADAGMGVRQYDFTNPVNVPYLVLNTGSTFQILKTFYDWILANC